MPQLPNCRLSAQLFLIVSPLNLLQLGHPQPPTHVHAVTTAQEMRSTLTSIIY